MSRRPSAVPFAKALFDVASREGQVERIGEEIAALTALTDAHPDLQRALTHPAVPPRAKRQAIDALASQLGVAPPVQRLLQLLADRDRLALLPEVNRAYQARRLQHLGVVDAQVTTAVPLSAEGAEAIARGLSEATGKQVRLTALVDPAIMGGVVARLGSQVFDGSVARQLERLRERLSESA
jgi:F-type H+-transporting ATPase subunit delta